MSMSEAFSLLYFNKTLLHKSSERSSLVSGPRLNSSPPEAKNPGVFRGSATTFQQRHFCCIMVVSVGSAPRGENIVRLPSMAAVSARRQVVLY